MVISSPSASLSFEETMNVVGLMASLSVRIEKNLTQTEEFTTEDTDGTEEKDKK